MSVTASEKKAASLNKPADAIKTSPVASVVVGPSKAETKPSTAFVFPKSENADEFGSVVWMTVSYDFNGRKVYFRPFMLLTDRNTDDETNRIPLSTLDFTRMCQEQQRISAH